MTKPKIVYRYKPANPGESFVSLGVPARDLTEADVADLSPEVLFNITEPGPTGDPMYVEVEHKTAETEAEKPAVEKGKTP